MAKKIPFKSYCWSIGTTSYRTDKFNMSIERQLQLLDEFRKLPGNTAIKWAHNNDFQIEYYKYLKKSGFVKGDAKRPDKDAREKTSGLRDIGLLDDERNLTEAGRELLRISSSEDYETDNFLEIPKDSYLYFRQLLKTSNVVEGKTVRPFVVFLYVVNELGFLTDEEFTYLLPLCIDEKTTKDIIERIKNYRATGKNGIDETILSVLMDMDNYKQALMLLQSKEVTEDLLCNVGLNRKSAKYDKPYYKIYVILKKIALFKENLAIDLYKATKDLTNSKVSTEWRKLLFKNTTQSVIAKEGLTTLKNVSILNVASEKQFNEEFFKIMHLFKAKATLSDYFDLNRRYFKITDVVLFEDSKVELDVLPKTYIEMISKGLLSIAFKQTNLLTRDVSLESIGKFFEVKINELYSELGKKFGVKIDGRQTAREKLYEEKYRRFNRLIDTKFDIDTIIKLLGLFEKREDDQIMDIVTNNAEVTTIFEYILGIAWYIISDRKGDVLEYMNLSLEADLLPKSHATGGQADIVWKYESTRFYPEHTLLIEATLSEGSGQRRMEMEPVSRHLGDYRLSCPDEEAYCVFVATRLFMNLISDFRLRKNMVYYNHDETAYIEGMKIIPLQTTELKTLLRANVKYPELYKIFEKAHLNDENPKEWYENNIVREARMRYMHR